MFPLPRDVVMSTAKLHFHRFATQPAMLKELDVSCT